MSVDHVRLEFPDATTKAKHCYLTINRWRTCKSDEGDLRTVFRIFPGLLGRDWVGLRFNPSQGHRPPHRGNDSYSVAALRLLERQIVLFVSQAWLKASGHVDDSH